MTQKGLPWAYGMLAIELVEALALTEVVFGDGTPSRTVRLLLVIVILTAVLQVAGILCVRAGRARLGGILQIVGSAPHAVKLDGIVGIIGGAQALRFARAPAPPPSTSEERPRKLVLVLEEMHEPRALDP